MYDFVLPVFTLNLEWKASYLRRMKTLASCSLRQRESRVEGEDRGTGHLMEVLGREGGSGERHAHDAVRNAVCV